jgi:hypothetical protein
MTPGKWEEIVEYILKCKEISFYKRTHRHMSCIRLVGDSVIKLCKIIYPISIVKKPIIRRLIDYSEYRMDKTKDRLTEKEIKKIAADVDYVRHFNRKKNIPYKWTGKKILEVYSINLNT